MGRARAAAARRGVGTLGALCQNLVLLALATARARFFRPPSSFAGKNLNGAGVLGILDEFVIVDKEWMNAVL